MKLATRQSIREIDRKSIRDYKISGMILMENAGRACAEVISRDHPEANKIAIICGGGNNGGDGFVIARQLISRGKDINTYLTKNKNEYKGDAKKNLTSLLSTSDSVIELDEKLSKVKEADLYIDCIFGTGIEREVSGFYRRIINFLNVVDKPVISIDIPSGLDCNSGKPLGVAVKADTTVTFVVPKIGMCIYPGFEYVGELYIANITTPKILEEKLPYELLTFDGINKIIKTRDSNSHKGSHGHLLVIAGSKGKSGAAILAANAAVRSGAGLVTVSAPTSVSNIIEANTTEAVSAELESTKEGSISSSSIKEAVNLLNNKKSALAIGPGLTTNKSTKQFFKELILNLNFPAIIDADGINILSDHLELLKKVDIPVILTPHPGEMARLCKLSIKEVQENRIDISLNFAKKHNCYLVLKGAKSIIADPNGNIFINPTGNPAMASGGMGDVLTGIIGSLLAQGYSPIDSCKLGTFIHGYTADLTVQEFGAPGIIASDVVENIPSSFKNIENQNELYFNII